MPGYPRRKRKEGPSATITRAEDGEDRESGDVFERVTKRRKVAADKEALAEWTEDSPPPPSSNTASITPVISLGGEDDGEDDEDEDDPFSMADLTQKRIVTVQPSQQQNDMNNNTNMDKRPIPYPIPPQYIQTPPGRDPDLPVLVRRGVPVKDCFAYSQISKYKKRYLTTLEQKVGVEAERNSARKENFQLKFTVAELTSNLTRARYNLKIVQQSEKKYFDRWVNAQAEIEALEKGNATIKQENDELSRKYETLDDDYSREMAEKDSQEVELIRLRHAADKMIQYIVTKTGEEKTLKDFVCSCSTTVDDLMCADLS